jgi:hypothetical protein
MEEFLKFSDKLMLNKEESGFVSTGQLWRQRHLLKLCAQKMCAVLYMFMCFKGSYVYTSVMPNLMG